MFLQGDPIRWGYFWRIYDPTIIGDQQQRQEYTKIKDRLNRIFYQVHENFTNSVPSDVHQFSNNEFPGYQDKDIFFLKLNPDLRIQRHQLSGLCYMHAPAVVQYYALCKNNVPKPQMVDILDIIRNNFTQKELEKYIFDDAGGDSKTFLRKILEPGSIVNSFNWRIVKAFKKYGVGLVSCFEVHEDFLNTHKHKHKGQPKGNHIGNHAMALVGHRTSGRGKLYLLLQNWWKNKQFIEVDLNYLKNCNAIISFIETPQTQIPTNFSRHVGCFFELEGVDKPEGHDGEMIDLIG